MQRNKQDGFILVTVLMVMVLIALVGSTLLIKSTSELKQSGNSEGQARARGYAEAAQADMFYTLANPGLGYINDAFTPYVNAFARSNSKAEETAIVPASAYPAVLAAIQAAFPALASPSTLTAASYTSTINFRSLRADEGSFNRNGQTYYLDYSITGVATANGNKRNVVTEGTMRINLGRQSLNQFILLADDGGSGSNGTSGFFDTSSTYDGPVHVNKNWALSGSPTFLAGATTASSYVWMNNARGCRGFNFIRVTGQQASPNGCTAPNTNNKGLRYNADEIDLPKNAFSQARAALGMDATNLDEPNNGQTCQALRDYLSNCSSIPNGTYVPSNSGRVTGGIYVQGDASVTLSTSGALQIYTIKDQNNRTTTITVNYAANTTTYVTGTSLPRVLTGVPNGQLYVSGNITALSGPARTGNLPNPAPTDKVPSMVQPALAPKTQLNVAAGGQVTLTGDVTYTDDPRQVATAENVLGIISGTGHVMVGDAAPKDIYVSGAILAGADGKGLGVQSPNQVPAKGAIHLLGSLAESTDQLRGTVNNDGQSIAGYADDFHFDQRFFNGAVAPPFFPATTKFGVQTGWPIQRTWNEK
ncbi:DUF4900 domain-containing protein (plasmid) [Deinococcus metallilatus]|uniref:DUF4900 domain-containing protein n=1 Tax=Deinococcus metallilatus TaxID=1211322 RepID=A0AAJ5JZV9_9DEIO|nr:DUF4900 domain-containing protein [Deinococcus metallilatus]MBB5293415.1 Tfp pilus assembly protein PilX [Deinococcus metallilatus]QBY06509.1 DUF4900 domain-containing protein [Deinococcus metallilatus]RXJ17852.1 DUF4900 domain-containing protein [Deinococcus metallilatus]TLK32124.1 DUF4900 domain-containing protein [Deinococcus metallilatus]GMA15364.1 DUF4900 domain-containing protein [Deinococcus metallilatus]